MHITTIKTKIKLSSMKVHIGDDEFNGFTIYKILSLRRRPKKTMLSKLGCRMQRKERGGGLREYHVFFSFFVLFKKNKNIYFK